jgi:2,4'-dihydroxyacetophenone dioxygenase
VQIGAWRRDTRRVTGEHRGMTTLYLDIETKNVKGAELPWVPFTPYTDQVFLKYHRIDPVRGEILVSMRVPPGMTLPTHYHTGIVIGHTLRGAWRYLEHDWVSEAGDTVFETAGSAHTPESCGDEEMESFFLIVGELEFVDADGNLLARENWKTSLQRYHAYCAEQGIEPQDLTGFTPE